MSIIAELEKARDNFMAAETRQPTFGMPTRAASLAGFSGVASCMFGSMDKLQAQLAYMAAVPDTMPFSIADWELTVERSEVEKAFNKAIEEQTTAPE